MCKLCFAEFSKFVNGVFHWLFKETTLHFFIDKSNEASANKLARKEWQEARHKLKTNKAYVGLDAEIEENQKEKRQFMREIAGVRTAVATLDIPTYLESEPVQSIFRLIGEIATTPDRIPSKREWTQFSTGLAKILHIRQGHRTEWIGKFTLEKYYDLLEDRDCWYPYQPVAKGRTEGVQQIGSQSFITRSDRYNLSEVPEGQRGAVVGRSVDLGIGKTKFPIIF